jgi:hypothetical protein
MSCLPNGFEALEPFAGRWSAHTMAGRSALRSSSTEEERQAFYAAGAPLLAKALDQLDTAGLAALNEKERRLMNLVLAFAHASIAIEVQGPDEAKHCPSREAMRITRSPTDG